jgi:hypothetical protein
VDRDVSVCMGRFLRDEVQFPAKVKSGGRIKIMVGNPILVFCVQRDRRRRRRSTLNGDVSHPARSKAPPAAEKTEKFKGAFTPNASAIANPNAIRRTPLNRAAVRVCQPTRRRSPRRISAPVEMTASVEIILAGKYQLSLPVYSTKREKFPQDTFGCPNGPHRPNLSATAERNESPSANRKNTELKLPICSFEVENGLLEVPQ